MEQNLLGSNNGRKRIITSNTNAHDDTPEDDKTDQRGGGRASSQGLGKGSKDDNDKLQTVHALSTDNISQHTKAELTDNGTGRGRQLDGVIAGGRELALAGVVDDAKHDGEHGDAEDIVRVSEEADTGNNTGSDMVPAKGSLVYLCEGETTTLVGVGDVSKVIVEVVEGIVTTARLGDGGGGTSLISHCWQGYYKGKY